MGKLWMIMAIKKRSLARELALLCAPLLIVGGLFGWSAWQKRGRTPQIEMTVRSTVPTLQERNSQRLPLPFTPDFKSKFRWDATLQGGPLSNYRFGWNEKIVAETSRGRVTIWQLKNAPKGWQTDAVSGYNNGNVTEMRFTASHSSNNFATHFREYEVDENAIPIDTQTLRWQGEMVAIPSDEADVWHQPVNASTLQRWAEISGAAKWEGALDLLYDANISGPVLLRQEKRTEADPSSINELEIQILLRQINRRSFRRLIAFDGTARRVLWTDGDEWNGHRYWTSWGTTGAPGRDGETLAFDVGKVPNAWGEVVFLDDVVFDIAGRGAVVATGKGEWVSQDLLDVFEQQTGGYRVKQRLVLRPRETTPR